ncbi:hypothetical protein [Candidatus Poriferisodalis sp.]|uniref:hypothetical protein n=1 Tax=Candidatus Poriferisodalis sp. TaxID=3101277 RepID=UPI003B01B285
MIFPHAQVSDLRKGDIRCWGANDAGQSRAPLGEVFSDLYAEGDSTCGLRKTGEVICWGDAQFSAPAHLEPFIVNLPEQHFTDITALDRLGVFDGTECSTQQLCTDAPLTRATMAVWLDRLLAYEAPNTAAETGPAAGMLGSVRAVPFRLTTIAASDASTCGITLDGLVSCWGTSRSQRPTLEADEWWNAAEPVVAPPTDIEGRVFTSISATDGYFCAASADGYHRCWETHRFRRSPDADASFIDVSVNTTASSAGETMDSASRLRLRARTSSRLQRAESTRADSGAAGISSAGDSQHSSRTSTGASTCGQFRDLLRWPDRIPGQESRDLIAPRQRGQVSQRYDRGSATTRSATGSGAEPV